MNNKIKTTALSAAVTMTFGVSSIATAEGITDAVNKAIKLGKDAIYADAPEWMQRTSVEIQVEKNFKPTIELETVQPIMQNSKDDMVFYQLNARIRNSKESYNL